MKFTGRLNDPATWLEPAPGKLAFRTIGQKQAATLVPLSRIVHERYSLYHEVTNRNS